MRLTGNTRSLRKKKEATIRRNLLLIRKSKTTIRKKSQEICGSGIEFPEGNILCSVFVDKHFNLVNKADKPNIELRFYLKRRKKNRRSMAAVSAQNWAPQEYVKIQRK